jgi:hypothetical protein
VKECNTPNSASIPRKNPVATRTVSKSVAIFCSDSKEVAVGIVVVQKHGPIRK